MKEYKNYLSFIDNKDVIGIYSKKDYNFNFRKMSKEELDSEINKLCNEVGISIKTYVLPKQSHTNNIVVVNEDNMNDDFVDVDGIFTNVKGIGIGTISADCQNILFYDGKKKVIGSVHSGWRGTYNNIVKEAINVMVNKYGCDIKDIECFITPSILECCFEVDEDLMIDFKNRYGDSYIIDGDIKDNKQKYYIDLLSITIDNLVSCGIESIDYCDICVRCNHEEFHSYRGDGIDSGRNIAFIVLK